MKKIYFLALLWCLSITAFAQTTVTLYSTGATGSYITGSAATYGGGTRADGTIGATTSAGGFSSRGYAVFNLSSIPAGATVTSCIIGFNVATYFGGPGSAWDTYGYVGNLSTVMTYATLYADLIAGTSLSTATYGAAMGIQTLPSTAASQAFVQANAGNTVSICWTGGGTAGYQITGETGTATTTGTHAPYLQITYTCAGVSGVTAVAAPTALCVGSSLSLTGNGTGTTSYSWAGPGGYTSVVQNTTLTTTASSAGVYTLTAYSASGCPTQATTAVVSLSPTPAAAITAGGPLVFCAGSNVVLTGTTAPGGTTYTYQWYSSGAPISGETNQAYTATLPGSYTVEITNTASGCAALSAASAVNVIPLSPPLTPAGPLKLCSDAYLTFAVDITGITTGLTYQWELGGIAVTGATNSTFTLNTPGVVSCILTTAGGGCSDTSLSTNVDIAPLPNPSVTYNGTVLQTSSLYTSFQWFLNTVAITGANSYWLAPPDNGSYRVVVTDTNGCSNFSAPYNFYTLGVQQVNSIDVKIFPNPAGNTVHISAPVAVRAVVTGVEGKKLLEQEAATDLDISGLANGVYIIMLYNDANERVAIDKLIKE